MLAQDALDRRLERVDGLLRRESKIEACLEFPGDHIRRARSRGNIRYLESRGLKMVIALIPGSRRQLGEGRGDGVYRVVGELRIGNVSLHSMHGEAPAQAAAPADLDGIAEGFLTRGLTNQAPIDGFLPLTQHFHHPTCAVDR